MTESGERCRESFERSVGPQYCLRYKANLEDEDCVVNPHEQRDYEHVHIEVRWRQWQAAFEAGREDGPTPVYVCAKAERDIPRILAAVMDSLIAQHAPDSISGYAIMDAILPFVVEMKSVPELPAPPDSGDKKGTSDAG